MRLCRSHLCQSKFVAPASRKNSSWGKQASDERSDIHHTRSPLLRMNNALWFQSTASIPAAELVGAVSLFLAGGASAGTGRSAAPPPKITFNEEEISDVSLGTFYVFDKENTQQFDSHSCRGLLMALHVRLSRCVTVEDKVASFDGLVAGKAGVVHRLVGGFAVVKVSEPPAAGRGVFS
jgi:hypothetical protein